MNERLLKKHFRQTPRMEPQDAVKLVFQSAFGCGHLLPARDRVVQRIRQEMDAVQPDASAPAFVPIGNGLCRLNLAAPEVRRLGADVIDRMMRITDEEVRARGGSEDRYEEGAALLRSLAQAGQAPFSLSALQDYLAQYEAAGRGVVSHTPQYRQCYAPAYRVVLQDLALLTPVLLSGSRLMVVDGPCGSGKSTLGGLLARMYGTTPVPMDDFFLPFDMRTPERLGQPGGNVHYERFRDEVLASLEKGGPVAWNRFSCSDGTLARRAVAQADAVVIEGSYSHHPHFRDVYDRLHALRIFVHVNSREQLRRIAARDPELVSMFQSRWIPLEKNYFEAYDIQGSAGVVIENRPWAGVSEEEDEP